MNDRELLEMAARAAGYVVRWYEDSLAYGPTFGIEVEPGNPCGFEHWNPLADDGDALRLAVTLKMTVDVSLWSNEVQVRAYKDNCGMHHVNEEGQDHLAVTRRAIVRAAAEIGKAMQEQH